MAEAPGDPAELRLKAPPACCWTGRALAAHPAREVPLVVTAVTAKAQRAGRVFIGWSQINPLRPPWRRTRSLRGLGHPTVATPITWDDVRACRRASQLVFTVDTIA